jgi:hypothetical protein
MSKLSFDQDTYFFGTIYHRETDTVEPRAVYRWYTDDDDVFRTEWWNPRTSRWQHNGRLVAAIGIGGDSDFEPTTEEEAMAFIERLGHAQQD